MKQTTLLAISTPQAKNNYYSALFDIKMPDGTKFFSSIKVGMACRACVRKGLQATCNHPTDFKPPWQGEDKGARHTLHWCLCALFAHRCPPADLLMQSLYGNRQDLLAREVRGEITADADSVFLHEQVLAYFNRTIQLTQPVRKILLAVDPNGGGAASGALNTLARAFAAPLTHPVCSPQTWHSLPWHLSRVPC